MVKKYFAPISKIKKIEGFLPSVEMTNEATDSTMHFQFITTTDPLYLEERALRAKILREPLGLPTGSEVFPFEREAWHLVAVYNEKVVGCVMFNPEGPTGRILQMAVAAAHQKQGVGTELMRALEARLAREAFREAYLHARDDAVPFYERLGYTVFGDPFVEVGITHRLMKKEFK